MQHKFLSMFAMLLLLAGSWPVMAEDESKPALLSVEEAAAIKNIVVYISQEQTEARQLQFRQNAYGGGMGILDMAVADIIVKALNEKDSFPPQGDLMTAINFKPINKSMKDGAFVQSINQIMRAPLEGETWLENVEIHAVDDKVNKKDLDELLQKRANPENLPDAVAIMKNRFVFGLDHYKLWFITDVEMYKPKAKQKNVKSRYKPQLLHQEKFVSLYDIRDHFEIPEQKNMDLSVGGEFVNNLWNKDDGKLFFDTVKKLATENARIMKQYLMEQPPGNVAQKPVNDAVLTLYEKTPEEKKIKKSRKMTLQQARKAQRKQDAEVLAGMSPIQRKAYMLRKEYQYTCPVEIMEKTADGVIARDLDKNVYYSVPSKNLKLVMQSEIDPKEYDELVMNPEKEPESKPVTDSTEEGPEATGTEEASNAEAKQSLISQE